MPQWFVGIVQNSTIILPHSQCMSFVKLVDCQLSALNDWGLNVQLEVVWLAYLLMLNQFVCLLIRA